MVAQSSTRTRCFHNVQCMHDTDALVSWEVYRIKHSISGRYLMDPELEGHTCPHQQLVEQTPNLESCAVLQDSCSHLPLGHAMLPWQANLYNAQRTTSMPGGIHDCCFAVTCSEDVCSENACGRFRHTYLCCAHCLALPL